VSTQTKVSLPKKFSVYASYKRIVAPATISA
jgi:hypothetical protein